ncbi:hypothetical protein CYMTET_49000 [Cymbomonas tetramitiformis]|uniref:Uncharacterized protein n=1 Tax=Cymbomonas tetramitiformis TaxID=36881 RepID=A0AAE0BR13_9CHLO|nr:hypothetical protein CYMTET_49000 [Cymbomonas tetramitiformis]
MPSISQREEVSTEDEEQGGDFEQQIEYTHTCSICGHEICKHSYSFEVESDPSTQRCVQKYTMECMLCGCGSDEKVIDEGYPTAAPQIADAALPGELSNGVSHRNDEEEPRSYTAVSNSQLLAGLASTPTPAQNDLIAEVRRRESAVNQEEDGSEDW